MNIKLFKVIIQILKYYVIISSMTLTGHCLLLINNIEFWQVDILFGLSLGGFGCLLLASYLLKMCNLYRLFLLHQFLVSSFISIQDNIGLGLYRTSLQIIMFTFGTCLILRLISNGFEENNCTTVKDCCG